MTQPRPQMPTMFDDFSFMGYWWRPEDPNKKWAGQVTCKPEFDIELEIIEEWGDSVTDSGFPLDINILHGTSPHFPYGVTLLRNQWIGGNSFYLLIMSGNIFARYRSEYLVTGHHFSLADSTIFKSVEVSFSNLRGWMWTDSPFSLNEEGGNRSLTFKPSLKRISLEIGVSANDSSVSSSLVLFERISEQKGPNELSPSEYKHERTCSIHLEPSTPQSLAWFREQIDGIRDLLAFLTSMYVETKSITATCAGSDSEEKEIDIYYFVRPGSTDADLSFNMSFPFRVLGEERTCSIFRTWFDKRDSLWSPVRLCLDVQYNPRQSNDDKLVALVRALESCRLIMRMRDRGVLENLKYLRNRLPQTLQDELRLTDTLLRSVKDTRHFLIHPDSDRYPHETRLHGLALTDAIVRLVPFAVALLYRQLGFCDEEICSVLNQRAPRGWWWFPNNEQA